MSQIGKVGVVYRGHPPVLLTDGPLESLPWRFEFFEADSLLSGAREVRRDFFVVFHPAGGDDGGRWPELKRIFPGSEWVRFVTEARAGQLPEPDAGQAVLAFPLPRGYLSLLLDTMALAEKGRRQLTTARHRLEGSRTLWHAFLSLVESAWSIHDRKLGVALVLNQILSDLRVQECCLYLLDPDDGITLRRTHTTGNFKGIDAFDRQENGAIVQEVFDRGEIYRNNRFRSGTPPERPGSAPEVRSILCLPLGRLNRRIGVIEALNKSGRRGFGPSDEEWLRTLAGPLSVALENIHMFESAERLTQTDDLTRLYNYRYLMQQLEAEVRRCLRYRKNVSLLFIDIDGFKKINDTFGHIVGSKALAEMGQMFRTSLRDTDMVGRYGGDEFVIVLPETPLNGAMMIAERIRKRVEDWELMVQGIRIRLTVSLGVANCPRHTLTAEGLIKKADAAMYRAKELSKNSIKVAV